MLVWKHWTTQKTGSEQLKMMSTRNYWHLLCMAVNGCTAFSRQLAPCWSIATRVLMSASSICQRLLHHGLCAKVPLYRIPLTSNHQWLHLQCAHWDRAWQADWHQVVFSDESHFNLWDHDDHVRVRCYVGQRCLPENVIAQYSGRTPAVMIWGAISYHERPN